MMVTPVPSALQPKSFGMRVALVRQGLVSVVAVDRFVHVLGWYFLLSRPSLSVFRDIYHWVEENRGGRAVLPEACKRELLVAAALAPLVLADVDLPSTARPRPSIPLLPGGRS